MHCIPSDIGYCLDIYSRKNIEVSEENLYMGKYTTYKLKWWETKILPAESKTFLDDLLMCVISLQYEIQAHTEIINLDFIIDICFFQSIVPFPPANLLHVKIGSARSYSLKLGGFGA